MANEFVARKGLISSGSINVSGSVTASYFKGDGSQLTNLPLSSSVNIDTYTFVGDGSTTNYLLSQSYHVSSLLISVEGLSQTNVQDYTLSGPTLSFVAAPPSESNILVKAFVNVTQNMTGSFSGSFFGIVTSASFAQTASFALNAGAGAGFPFSGSAVITGSLQMVDTANRGGITGSVSGALTGTFPYSGLIGTPTLVSASSQIDYDSIQNKLSGVISSSTQFNALTGTSASFATTASAATSITFVPTSASYALTASFALNAAGGGGGGGTISSSAQFKTLTDPFTGSFTGSFTGNGSGLTNIPIAVQTDNYTFTGDGVTTNYILSQSYDSTSVSVFVAGIAYANIIDYIITGPTASLISAPPSGSNILIKALLNKTNATGSFTGSFIGILSGVTSSGHIVPSIDSAYDLGSPSAKFRSLYLSGSTLYLGNLAISSKNGGLSVAPSGSPEAIAPVSGTFTGSYTGSFVGDGSGLTGIASAGTVSASSQIDYNSIQNKLSGVVSSSAQVQPLLPADTVSSSAQTIANITGQVILPAGVTSSNHITPSTDNTYNLGAIDKRWANVYTGDLNLSNEGSSGNSVDGTTGNWTIQEGENSLYILNNKNGKKFKIMLEEIE